MEKRDKKSQTNGNSGARARKRNTIYDGEAEYPIIAVNMDSISLNPTDVEIYEVQIVNNVLKIKGRDKESREVVEFEPNDVFAGHLSYIIDYLPGDEDVSGAN
mgnify:CR=1 FL=1